MRKLRTLMLLAALPLLLGACGPSNATLVRMYNAKDYQWHKQTNWIKVHWNISHPDGKTAVAEGFVEPFDPMNGVFAVKLNLVGLDADGKPVDSASGRPADYDIVSPFDYSPFSIKMELSGKEKGFTMTGSYYYYKSGMRPGLDQRYLDHIPLTSDEPL